MRDIEQDYKQATSISDTILRAFEKILTRKDNIRAKLISLHEFEQAQIILDAEHEAARHQYTYGTLRHMPERKRAQVKYYKDEIHNHMFRAFVAGMAYGSRAVIDSL